MDEPRGQAMTDNTQRNLLVMQLESLRRWRRDAWDAFEKTGDRRFHSELLAADEAGANLLKSCVTLRWGRAMKITVDLDKEQAETLLKFLRRVGPKDLEQIHDELDWSTFDAASRRLRLAIIRGEEKRGIEP
jgi:hypothetical protein